MALGIALTMLLSLALVACCRTYVRAFEDSQRGSRRVCNAGAVSDQREVVIVRWPDQGPPVDRMADLLAAYHLQTEAEKGEAVVDADGLPHRYRAEVLDPRAAFADGVVLMALSGATAVGCLVVTAPVDGQSEIKRLWTDPSFRSRGVASSLVSAALAQSAEWGVSTVRLSVWEWRAGAIALYERLGFTVAESWEERDQLVCMKASLYGATAAYVGRRTVSTRGSSTSHSPQ